MPRDTNGVYTLPPSYFVQTGDTILPNQHNPPMEDMANALTNSVDRDGRTVMTGNLQMGGNKITGLSDGENPGDAARIAQVVRVDDEQAHTPEQQMQARDNIGLGNSATRNVGTTAGTVAAGDEWWGTQPIGVPIPLLDNLVGVAAPPTDKGYRYIKLTASDGYNSGVLTGQSVTGSAPLVVATAVISLSGSPINGQTVNLINTERRFLRAGNAGSVENDAVQNITGSLDGGRGFMNLSASMIFDGAFARIETGTRDRDSSSGAGEVSNQGFTFDASRVARTDDETRPKNIGVTYFMRVL